MKRFLISLFCILTMISISACGSTKGVTVETDSELSVVSSTKSKGADDVDDAELHSSDTDTKISSSEECSMKLLISLKRKPNSIICLMMKKISGKALSGVLVGIV